MKESALMMWHKPCVLWQHPPGWCLSPTERRMQSWCNKATHRYIWSSTEVHSFTRDLVSSHFFIPLYLLCKKASASIKSTVQKTTNHSYGWEYAAWADRLCYICWMSVSPSLLSFALGSEKGAEGRQTLVPNCSIKVSIKSYWACYTAKRLYEILRSNVEG